MAADDLAAKLARAFTLAAGRMLPTSGYQPGKVTELLAADLRVILPELTGMACYFCHRPAVTIESGYAVCEPMFHESMRRRIETPAPPPPVPCPFGAGADPVTPATLSERRALDRIAAVLSRHGTDYAGMLTDIATILVRTGRRAPAFGRYHPDPEPYTCPHSDPLCPCLGPDHEMAREHAFQQGWDYDAERGDR